jgi:hypothetical protein
MEGELEAEMGRGWRLGARGIECEGERRWGLLGSARSMGRR